MLKEELKKIWRPGILGILAVLGFVFYTLFLQFYIQYFPNGPEYEGLYRTARELVETYGPSLSADEIRMAEADRLALYAEAEVSMASNDLFKKHGLQHYEEYLAFYQDAVSRSSDEITANNSEDSPSESSADSSGNGSAGGTAIISADGSADSSSENSALLQADYEDAVQMERYLKSEAADNIGGRIYAIESYLERYHYIKTNGPGSEDLALASGTSRKEFQHARSAFFGESQAWQNILPPELPEAASAYLGRLLIWICLSVCLLLAPLPVQDRICRMRSLQWGSRLGRGVLPIQLRAVMLSAFLLTTLNLAVFGGFFALHHGISDFFSCRMYSFLFTGYTWPNWTFGLWCAVLILLCYLIALGTAAFAFVLSQSSSNYISMILKLIPLIAAAVILCPRLISMGFYFQNAVYRLTGLPYAEAFVPLLIFFSGLVLCTVVIKKKEKADLITM